MKKNKPAPFPQSQYSPIQLERPLKLFGSTFEVLMSTPLTFSPATIFKSAGDMSLWEVLRLSDDGSDQLVRALQRGVTRRNKLSATTSAIIKQKLSFALSVELLEEVLAGNEPNSPPPLLSDWESLLLGMLKNDEVTSKCYAAEEDSLLAIVMQLAHLDRIALSAKDAYDNGKHEEGNMLLAKHIGDPLDAWRKQNPALQAFAAILIDVSLQVLARLEVSGFHTHNSNVLPAKEYGILYLLSRGKKPIGHWIAAIQKSAHSTNLNEVCKKIASKGFTYHGRVVSHDLLKKWSSCQQLIPKQAGELVIESAAAHADKSLLSELFAKARFMSFLCDLIISSTRGDAPSWVEAQAQLYSRYEELWLVEYSKSVKSPSILDGAH